MGWQLRDPIGSWLQSDRTRSMYQLYSGGGQHKISLVVLHFPDKVLRPSVNKSSLIKCFIFILLLVIFFFICPIRNSPLSVNGHCLTFFCCVSLTRAPQQAPLKPPVLQAEQAQLLQPLPRAGPPATRHFGGSRFSLSLNFLH